MVVCCVFRTLCTPYHTLYPVDRVSEVCPCHREYYLKPSLLPLCFERIYSRLAPITLANMLVGTYRHCRYGAECVLCIFYYGQGPPHFLTNVI